MSNLEYKSNFYDKVIKRIFDIIIALFVLIIGFIPLIIFAIWVKLDSKGGVIFKQKRVGKDFRVFSVYKLRSMIEDEYDSEGNMLKDRDRVTKPGKLARSLSVDEIPQLLNVLKGDMSLIGPRPLPVRYFPYYTEEELMRHAVRPGITGLAQVKGRAFMMWEDRFENDLYYVNNISFPLDVRIFFMTIRSVFKREGTSAIRPKGLRDFNIHRGHPRNSAKLIYPDGDN